MASIGERWFVLWTHIAFFSGVIAAGLPRRKYSPVQTIESRKMPDGNLIRALLPAAMLCLLPFLAAGGVPQQAKPPTALEQRILQVQDLMQQGDLVEARKLLLAAMKQHKAEPGLDNLLGIIEAREKNYRAAETAFKRAVARSPKFTGAYLNLGRLYQENVASDPEAVAKAIEVYQRVLQYQPGHAEANYQSAALLQLRGEYRSSLARLQRLPDDLRQSAQSLAVFCADYAGLGDAARADESASRLLAHSDFSETDVNAALPALTKAGRIDLAIRLIEGLASRATIAPEMIHQLGLLYEQQGQLDRARATLEKAAVKDRPLVPLLIDLARVAHKQRDYQGTLGYLAHARDLEPTNAAIHYFFGMVCVDLNLGAEAYVAVGKAVSLEPDNPHYNFAMGFVAAHRHDPEESVPYLRKYLLLNPGDARARLVLGMAYYRSKNYEAATKELQEAVKRRETAAPAHFYLGSVARQENKIDEAIRELEQALQLEPDYADALAEVGQCRIQQKNYELAEKSLRRALEIKPDHYAGNFNLLTLYTRTKDPRAEELAKRFEEIKKRREEKAQEFLRGIEVRPYGNQR
jgi:tetratricopeptide (TPR) repeat protein